VLPLLGVLNLPEAQLATLNQLGHALALYFVLPVGSLTTIINFTNHRKRSILTLAVVGITLVGLANGHFHHLPTVITSILPPVWTRTIEHVLHLIQDCGGGGGGIVNTKIPWHRITNVSGCAMLLTSNYLSQQQGCAYHDHDSHDCDGHDGHDHQHNHDHDH
jgi:MerC mercury resistance protein